MGDIEVRKDKCGEFDELFVHDATSVHVERMDTASFWISVNRRGNRPTIHIRTGLLDGKWWFSVEEDGRHYEIVQCDVKRNRAVEVRVRDFTKLEAGNGTSARA